MCASVLCELFKCEKKKGVAAPRGAVGLGEATPGGAAGEDQRRRRLSRLVIFAGNPFIPHMLVLTIRAPKNTPLTTGAIHHISRTYSSMRNQPSRDIIRFLLETEQDVNLTEQELDQWIEQRDQEAEEEIKSILQKISAETMSAIPLESVENEADKAEKEIDIILERLKEPQKRSKEDQPLVLVKPPTLPCIFVRPYKGVVVKERSQIFYTADTFVSADDDAIDSYVLEVSNELLNLNEGMSDELLKAIDASFVVDISKGEGITWSFTTSRANDFNQKRYWEAAQLSTDPKIRFRYEIAMADQRGPSDDSGASSTRAVSVNEFQTLT
ncbi:hypothetical protein Sjap_008820 [Stephania japonica]|uniref:Uncharacterized protein n=1 Tax=Stephania japonica TaxID=461633 RepID=A0AAP0JR13_9MAGN